MKRWYFWVSLVVSALFLYLALRGLQFNLVFDAIKSANLLWLLAVVPIYFTSVWFRSLRWNYLLRPIQKLPTKEIFSVVAIGYMGNNIFPARAGELLRSAVLKRRYQIPISASLASIIVERIIDGVVMLGFIFFNLTELNKLTDSSGFVGSIRSLALWGSLAFIGALLFFLIAAKLPHKTEAFIRWVAGIFPQKWQEKILTIGLRFITGIEALNSWKSLGMVLGTSVVIWLLETSVYWVVMRAFPMQVSFFGLMLMNGILNLSTTLPSAPGYIGTFDAPGIALMSAYGVGKTLAAGYTLVLHAALWLPVTLLGAYYFTREGLSWSNELEAARAAKEGKQE
ncbi:MAG: glycosyltransferase 2 family protein [Chloroflexota bacterium]|nr:glycosyltransferase 2 family protein [Chloroflexota bacterium]